MQQHLYGIKAMESMQEENKDKKTLSFSDNGIGMTAEEVEKYITQDKPEFAKKRLWLFHFLNRNYSSMQKSV